MAGVILTGFNTVHKWGDLVIQVGAVFLSSLRLLSQKAQHRDSDTAAAMLAQFLKALYFRRCETWMLHILYMVASCYEVSVSHMSNVLDLIFMVQ